MAQIVETLRLQHEHPEREQYAWDSLQEDGYNCSRLWLIKEYDSAFLFGMELMPDEDNEEECDEDVISGILVYSQDKIRYVDIYCYLGEYYTDIEISVWRLKYFEALEEMERKFGTPTKQERIDLIVGLDNMTVVRLMHDSSPETYADYITM